MGRILRRFGLAVSVLAASLAFSTATPASATTPLPCPAGTYVSSYDASICNSTPPGTFTATADATEPIPCDPGEYQPYYGQTFCRNTPPGSATVSAGSEVPNNCSPGTFANNEGSDICLPAPGGMYIPDLGATSAIPCPAAPPAIGVSVNDSRTGNTKVIDCFDFGVSTLVLPTANSTVNNEINFEFFLNTEIASGDNVRLTFTDVVAGAPRPVYQIVAQENVVPSESKRGTITVPLAWQNTSYFRGCSTSCLSGAPITSLPLSTYDIKVEAKDKSTPSVWVDLGTVGAVQVTDTVTTKPQIYLQAWSYFLVTESVTVGLVLPENRKSDSAIVKISDAPKYLSPTISKTYILASGALSDYIALPFSGPPTSLDVLSVSSEVITPGQWWVSVSYKDAIGNPIASDEWLYPMLITRSCDPGTFSVDGIQECIPVPAGRWITYPSQEAFNLITRLFEPSQCAVGSYQPSPGGTACLLADPGYFVSQPGSLEQTVCPLGKYQPSTNARECLLAAPGTYVDKTRSTASLDCPLGTYQPSPGATSCLQSAANFYVAESKSVSQQACPVMTYSSSGATSVADCKPQPCVVTKGKSATSACMLASIAKVLPAKAKVTIKMSKSFKKICKVKGSKIKALKPGTCTVTITVKPKKGKSIKYRVNVTGI